jgi:hypothetical protein
MASRKKHKKKNKKRLANNPAPAPAAAQGSTVSNSNGTGIRNYFELTNSANHDFLELATALVADPSLEAMLVAKPSHVWLLEVLKKKEASCLLFFVQKNDTIVPMVIHSLQRWTDLVQDNNHIAFHSAMKHLRDCWASTLLKIAQSVASRLLFVVKERLFTAPMLSAFWRLMIC